MLCRIGRFTAPGYQDSQCTLEMDLANIDPTCKPAGYPTATTTAWLETCQPRVVHIGAQYTGTKYQKIGNTCNQVDYPGQLFSAKWTTDLDLAYEVYKNVTVANIWSSPVAHPDSATPLWTGLEEALKNRDILPLPYKVQGGLDKTAEAFEAIKKASGYKVIVHPQE